MRRLTLITNPDKCNLRCPLCFLNQRGRAFARDGGMGEMPIGVAIAAIEKAARESVAVAGGSRLREVIPSTMGEPLLYSEFEKLMAFCESCGIPLNLTTNGSFPGKWGTEAGMMRLLLACSDIKMSCMGWGDSFAEMMPGLAIEAWKANLERLLQLRSRLRSQRNCATVSLQVTLHRKNAAAVEDLLFYAKNLGVNRVKLNVAVFLSTAPRPLLDSYALPEADVLALRKKAEALRPALTPMRLEGSLFFERHDDLPGRGASVGAGAPCRFDDELWILPDGSVEHCPNPERRFGDSSSEKALCENCPMRG